MFKTTLHQSSGFFSRFILVLVILGVALLPNASQADASFVIPTMDIINVVAQKSVTIRANNWPANETFTVRMGNFGSLAVGGTVIATTTNGTDVSFVVTYAIPENLKNEYMIAIRTDSSTGFFYSYNWFYNINSDPQPGLVDPPPSGTTPTKTPKSGSTVMPFTIPVYNGIPSFSIISVADDNTVTITTSNFPAKQTFTVSMAEYGLPGLGGVEVATTESGNGGKFEATYTIPDSLKSLFQIAIRMNSSAGYYSYNWFYNTAAE